jgi:hypothetical protein
MSNINMNHVQFIITSECAPEMLPFCQGVQRRAMAHRGTPLQGFQSCLSYSKPYALLHIDPY